MAGADLPELKFSPEKNTMTLHGGDTGSLSATAIAKSTASRRSSTPA